MECLSTMQSIQKSKSVVAATVYIDYFSVMHQGCLCILRVFSVSFTVTPSMIMTNGHTLLILTAEIW